MGFSSGSLGLPGEDPAERQLALRMVGNSSPRPAAHSSREAVGGAETATRSQGHAAHKGARKRTLPKALPPGPPCAPGRPRAASHSQRSLRGNRDVPGAQRTALRGGGTRSVVKARRTLPGLSPCPRGERQGRAPGFLFCLAQTELRQGPGTEKALSERVSSGCRREMQPAWCQNCQAGGGETRS